MKIQIIALVFTCQVCLGGMYIYEIPDAPFNEGMSITLEHWDTDSLVTVAAKPSIVPADVIRIIISKRVVPEITQEQIDEALATMSEVQRKAMGKDIKPSPPREYISFSFILTNDGARKFKSLTESQIGRELAFVVGNKVISTPKVREPIINGIVNVSGVFENTEELLKIFPPSNPKVFVSEDILNQ